MNRNALPRFRELSKKSKADVRKLTHDLSKENSLEKYTNLFDRNLDFEIRKSKFLESIIE